MTAITTMTMRTSILRNKQAGSDSWGQPDVPDFEIDLDDLPCRAWLNQGREAINGRESVVLEDRRVLVPLGTNVTESDQLGDIKDREGHVLFEGPMVIEAVGRRQDHLEIMLAEVSS